MDFYIDGSIHQKDQAFLSRVKEPTTYKEAITCPEKEKWIAAMDKELKSLQDTGTYKIVKLPPGQKTVGTKWVYKIKYTAAGEVERYKARLVVKGFTQKKGIDFDETYAPVTRLTSIRMLLAIAASQGLDIATLDVDSAYLHGDIDHKIYLKFPEGFRSLQWA